MFKQIKACKVLKSNNLREATKLIQITCRTLLDYLKVGKLIATILVYLSFSLQTQAVQLVQLIDSPKVPDEVQNTCADIDSLKKTVNNTTLVEIYNLHTTVSINGRNCYRILVYELNSKDEIRLVKSIFRDTKTYEFVRAYPLNQRLMPLTEWHTTNFGSLEYMIQDFLEAGRWTIENGTKNSK